MWRKSRNKPQAGFTIPEVLVTLIILVAILVVAAQVLFETRNAAERQRAQVEARQFARSAVEYLHFMLRGSTDLNTRNQNFPNPLSLLIWVAKDSGSTTIPVQVSFDNLTAAQAAAGFGDEGTDLLTFARADNVLSVPVVRWPGNQHAATLCFEFTLGCPDSTLNLQLFKQATGAHMVGPKEMSEVFLVVGDDGQAGFMQITDYQDGVNADCCVEKERGGLCNNPGDPADTTPVRAIKVQRSPGLSGGLNPPGGYPNLQNPRAELGVRYVTLRVRNGWLEQKNSAFDPENPNDGFFQVLPNVEDLQIAYLFRDGSIRNATVPRDCGWATNCVPVQDSTVGNTLPPNHAANVIGLRVSITARSTTEMPITQEPAARFLRPAAENRPGATVRDRFYRYQTSTMILLRNRSPQA
uniref:Type II secretion system protein n=1 Tax=Thermoanaerobaculum aquaticum TaxID=1312852 RepID=A0A7V2EFI2_9BACT